MNSKTILLVEDNPDDIALTQAAFASMRSECRLLVAETAEVALARLLDTHSESPELPDLVLLDLKLGGVDGFELLQKLRSCNARAALVPVVVLTSSLEERDILRGYQLGANSYVRKPIDFDEFLVLARKLVDYWLAINQSPVAELGG